MIASVRTKFTQAARKHRIGTAHALYVMRTSEPVTSTRPNGEPELSWIGRDSTGRELEVTAVITPDVAQGDPVILVLHVMPTSLRRAT